LKTERDVRKLVLAIGCLILCPSALHAEVLTVGTADGIWGQVVDIPITVDIPGNITGASFTVTYSSQYFTLTEVQSTFFDTFPNQWALLASPPDPLPPSQVEVGGQTYTSPLVVRSVTDATLLAAARVEGGAIVSTLFTLRFEVDEGVPDGIYPVSITPTVVTNTDAGYPPEGMAIPLLFPQLTTAVINGSINVDTPFVDSDRDGIDDNWEIANFGNLTTANATSDYDKDGYTDLQEYLNQQNSETDPLGAAYNPKIRNAPGGTGYYDREAEAEFWLLMLPAMTRPGN
jgi:hypothetical protein